MNASDRRPVATTRPRTDRRLAHVAAAQLVRARARQGCCEDERASTLRSRCLGGPGTARCTASGSGRRPAGSRSRLEHRALYWRCPWERRATPAHDARTRRTPPARSFFMAVVREKCLCCANGGTPAGPRRSSAVRPAAAVVATPGPPAPVRARRAPQRAQHAERLSWSSTAIVAARA
ncbi:hypothetical protein HBB16_04070 [Pseudonocardia sp. MCCB 268]|nr:hypothetical protein [Pseudonocardia cytotoxica]